MTETKLIANITAKQKAGSVLLVSAAYGVVSSFVLTLEKIHSLTNPGYIPSCSINPIISCSNAMNSTQAEIFGIPNSLFGIAAYASLFTVAVLIMMGTKFSRLIWTALAVAAFAAVVFVFYLIIQSVFFMHVICPWCFGIWVTTPLLFTSIVWLGSAGWGDGRRGWVGRVLEYISTHQVSILVIWYVLLIGTLGFVFWDFWMSLL